MNQSTRIYADMLNIERANIFKSESSSPPSVYLTFVSLPSIHIYHCLGNTNTALGLSLNEQPVS